MKRLAVIAVLIAVLAAGCGDDKDKDGVNASDSKNEQTQGTDQPGSDDGDSTTPTSGGAGVTTPGGGTAQPPATNGGGTQPGPGGSTTTTKAPFPVQVKLGKTCVEKGLTGDSQVLEVKTRPGDTVAWSTEYSDHSNELSKPEYKKTGGSGYGKADGDGNFKSEWKVPAEAPNGTARLHIIADSRIVEQKPEFQVVSDSDDC